VNKPSEACIEQRENPTAPTTPESMLRIKLIAGFALAILLTCVLGFLSWRTAQQAAEDADWVAHTDEVSMALEVTLRHLLDAETGGRGFAMSGRPSFLEPYEAGRNAVGQDLLRLRLLTVKNADLQLRLDTLEKQVNTRIEASRNLVAARQNTGQQPSEAQLELGKQLMDRVRATIGEMEGTENRLLQQRLERTRAARRLNLSLIALGALLGLTFLALAGAAVNREIRISTRARAQVISLNADLERRVEQRTTALRAEIQSRKDAEAALRESEGRVAGIVQSAMDPIITLDQDQRIVMFNDAAEKVFQCTAEDALGSPISRFIPQRFHAAHAENIRKFGEAGVTNRALGQKDVLWAVRAGGQEFPIEASISQAVTDGEKLFTIILRDVTNRRQSDALRERMAAIVEFSNDAIISATLDGTILAWNRGAEKVFGYPSSEAIGSRLSIIIPAERAHEKTELLGRVAQGISVEHFETVRVRKDGREIDVSVTISPIRDRSGAVVAASTIARDITESKHVEAALTEQTRMFELVLESMGEGLIAVDREGRFVSWNDAAKRLVGRKPDGIPGEQRNTNYQVFLPDGITPYPADALPLVRAMRGESVQEELIVERPGEDGRVLLEVAARPMRDARGELCGGVAVLHDITERKLKNEELRESNERFQALANGIPQLVWMAGPDGHIFWYNQRWYDYTGTTLEQMQGWDWQSVHDPEMLPKVLERWNGSIARGEPFDMEFPLRGADGRFRTFLTRVMPFRDADGRVTRWFGTNTDISEQKESQRQLEEQAAELARLAMQLANSRQELETQSLMLRSVLDSMTEGLVAADEQGKLILWNPAAERIVGQSVVDRPPEEWSLHYRAYLPDTVTLFPPEQNPLLRAISGEVSSAEMFMRIPEVEQGIWIESNGSPLIDKGGVLRGGVTAFRDITRQKVAELEIRKLNESLEERIAQRTMQLENANRELDAFTYSVSHDLRAPLRHIHGFASAFLEEFGATVDPQALHYLMRIQDGTQRMGVLIGELLNLARTGKQPLRLQRTGLGPIVREILSMLHAETEGREVEWEIGDLPAANCDPVLVRQIFQNLLANAIKYTRPRARAVIEVGHAQEGDETVIFVRDNGVGFDMRYADKLFGVFQRLHRDEDFEGTGVGLATVYRIVQKHGGRVWAEAEVGRGATFYFTLEGSETQNSPTSVATAAVAPPIRFGPGSCEEVNSRDRRVGWK